MRILKIAILVFLCVCLRGQSVIKKVFSSVGNVATVSALILNQGQTTHTLYAQWLNSGGTCNPVGYIQIEASYDGTAYFGITPAPIGLYPITGGKAGSISISAGPFPYLRANLYNGAGTNCVVNAWYSGGTYSVSQPQMLQSISGQWRQQLATGSTADRSIAGSASGQRPVIYALTIGNLNTTDVMTVTITENSSVCTAGTLQTFLSLTVPAGGNIVIPGGPVPFATGSTTASIICAHFAGSSLNYSISSITRSEQ